jgi:hypothetical protein
MPRHGGNRPGRDTTGVNPAMHDESTRERFWAKVDRSDTNECWPWTAYRDKHGYGHFRAGGRSHLAHRVAYEIQIGPIADDLDVLHSCDNPPCQRGEHFFTGTAGDNARDMAAKGRQVFQRHPEKIRRGDNHWSKLHPDRVVSGERLRPHLIHRGDDSVAARLTGVEVTEMRRLFAEGGHAKKALARRFGVGQTQVQRILTRQSWRHLP